ncbi:hypothetical protein PIB30_044893 [Stylosanthes scabra]|uniref:DM2 domain-containing protein n=1 Tax=Stylosanthes scabra TaxID=79078 RepID=A0ABU6UFP6_9FABA|nr:hypothetical protein [Stylosanthes scabra]
MASSENNQGTFATIETESIFYTRLVEFEARVDDAFAKRRIEIQEALRSYPSVRKTLRVYVFNTFAKNQTLTDFLTNKQPQEAASSWSLKILGSILEDNDDPSPIFDPKFSTFFKRIIINLDQRLYPDDHEIVWQNSLSTSPTDGLDIKRNGDKEFMVRIKLEMNYCPQKHVLSPELSQVLGIRFDSHARIVSALLDYIKSNNLQIVTADPFKFKCDLALQRIFGEHHNTIEFKTALESLSHHLSKPEPIELEHRVVLSGNSGEAITCYDLKVDVPLRLDEDISEFLAAANAESKKQIAKFRKVKEYCRRRRFFLLFFCKSTQDFVNDFIAYQRREMNLNLNIPYEDPNQRAEKRMRTQEHYNKPWVEEVVLRYMNGKRVVNSNNNNNAGGDDGAGPSNRRQGRGRGDEVTNSAREITAAAPVTVAASSLRRKPPVRARRKPLTNMLEG